MLLHTRGIVFRSIRYGETSAIADIFTEEKGLRSFIGGGVRTPKSRMPFGLFQPMMVVDLVAYFRDADDHLNRLKEMRAAEVFVRIPFDIRRGAVALFMAEICRKSIHAGEENPGLFAFILDHLHRLDTTDEPIANLHLHFLLHLAGFLGFQPQYEPGNELFFDLKEGVFLPVPPPHPLCLEPAHAMLLLELLQTPLEDCHHIALGRPERKALLGGLLQFYQLHMPGFSDIHTPEILELVMEA
ncbi:MAG: DNA repair protein RecO [Saprospirales bacterium]|jgi:DNA repair protein RecO (recombination protein O)|nr:DNA repair protein RecO [Saprospirales bacterium]MBK8922537.1 DNA repair protein RecO [Saprospirales bacterium]